MVGGGQEAVNVEAVTALCWRWGSNLRLSPPYFSGNWALEGYSPPLLVSTLLNHVVSIPALIINLPLYMDFSQFLLWICTLVTDCNIVASHLLSSRICTRYVIFILAWSCILNLSVRREGHVCCVPTFPINLPSQRGKSEEQQLENFLRGFRDDSVMKNILQVCCLRLALNLCVDPSSTRLPLVWSYVTLR